MSVNEVMARIGSIQGQISSLNPMRATGGSLGTAFADDLAAATSASGASLGGVGSTSAVEANGVTGIGAVGGGGSSPQGDAVVAEAKKHLGVPYVWGGTNPASGLDCSGLTQLAYKAVGYDIPRVSYQQATAGAAVPGGLANARPGDLLAFGSPVNHVGIYLGDNRMIEAPRPGLNVRIAEIPSTPTAVRRIVTDAPVGSGSAAPMTAVSAMSSARGTTGVGDVPYADLFTQAGARYGVDAKLLAAVARQESGFNPSAVSPAGAQGLMQLMPATAKGLGVTNSFNPAQAVDGAARLLKALSAEFGRTDLALAAYNAGPGAVHRYGGIPPYRETQNYVSSIMSMLGGGAR